MSGLVLIPVLTLILFAIPDTLGIVKVLGEIRDELRELNAIRREKR